MIRLGRKDEIKELGSLIPEDVSTEMSKLIDILDENYGANRDIEKDLGGYLLLMESSEDFDLLREVNIDPASPMAEFVDTISTTGTRVWLNVLFLLGSDFSISLFFPKEIAPEKFLREIGGSEEDVL